MPKRAKSNINGKSNQEKCKRFRQNNATPKEVPEREDVHTAVKERKRRSRNAMNLTELQTERIINRNSHAAARARSLSILKNSAVVGCNIENEDEFVHYIGGLDSVCEFCNALHFEAERPQDKKFSSCCHKGKVKLTNLHDPQPLIKSLLTGARKRPTSETVDAIVHKRSVNFHKNILKYNSALAFVSLGAPGRIRSQDISGNRGVYVYKIHGSIYHESSPLYPGNEQQPAYAQLYIYDNDEATTLRMEKPVNSNCDRQIMYDLHQVISTCSPYAEAYRMMHEIEKQERVYAGQQNRPINGVNMWITSEKPLPANAHRGQYNTPSSNDVAIVFFNTDGEPPLNRDICVYPRGSFRERLGVLSPNRDPMTYPLFFPHGEKGWYKNMPLNTENQQGRSYVSHLQFYSYRLAIRRPFNILLNGGKLTQQYIVDMYCTIEANRLNYYRTHQREMRVSAYQGLIDQLNTRAENNDCRVGKMVILPSSYSGGPRAQHQNFIDSMAIVAELGKPDLFITFTCNPKWREIFENLEPWQNAEDRPDLVSRVFNLKAKSFVNDISKKHIFGTCIGIIYVIEWQKRGLPHMHLTVHLSENDKIRNSDKVDKIISAQLPDPSTNPKLSELVTKHMIHGPCGYLNPRSPCMQRGKCQKKFPRQYQATTILNDDGYPTYKREENGRTVKKGKCNVDNRYVVPYNPWLLARYEAHINVEVCSTIKAIRYLFKYFNKGHPCGTVKFVENGEQTLNHDEIANYLDCRYVCSQEAMWRILEYPMHYQSHTIHRLAIHLPLQQSVYFQICEEETALRRAAAKDSPLLAYFKLNSEDPNARQYLYTEIPKHYTWIRNKWQNRKATPKPIVTRMYAVSPSDKERYFLRLLLLHVRGAVSFEDLRTHDSVIYDNFFEAAKAKGFICDDQEWDRCLAEATQYRFPDGMRELFVIICVFCNLVDSKVLWEKYKDQLSEDHLRNNEPQTAYNKALLDIQELLKNHGKSLQDFYLPNTTVELRVENLNAVEELREGERMKLQLSEEQLNVFNAVVNAVENSSSGNRLFFLTAEGGGGKSFLMNALCAYLRGYNRIVLPCSLTGIAANLLRQGRTLHSQYGLPLNAFQDSTSRISPNSNEAKIIKEAQLLIIDEVSMLNEKHLTMIDRLLRDITKTNHLFGNKVVLLAGDFRQILSVVKNGTRTKIVEACVRSSSLRPHFKTYKLTQNMRVVSNQDEFSSWLIKLGNGDLPNELGVEGLIKIPPQFVSNGDLISEIFGNRISYDTIDDISDCAILTPKNTDTFEINDKIMEILEGEYKEYYSIDEYETSESHSGLHLTAEFLHKYSPSGFPLHILKLKRGTIIMLLRNLNTKRGLCNGTRAKVIAMHTHIIEVKILTGSAKGQTLFIPRIELAETDLTAPFRLKRRQFPIRVSFCMTINKSQGNSMTKVGIYLREKVFSHGQLYVAFSRARSADGVKILIKNTETQGKLKQNSNEVYTQNVVFREVLE